MSEAKANMDKTLSALASGFEPRKWQESAVYKIRNVALNGADRALVYACPGSGKTYAGLLIAKDLATKAGKGPKIVVLTPNLAIKSQWIDRAATIGLRLVPVVSGDDLRQDSLAIEEIGFIMSYQQAVSMRHSLRLFCDTVKPIVILDEVHHTEGPRADRDGNAWGHSVEVACAPASFKLCTTGTPFREGNNPISFVRYDDNQHAISDVEYSYGDALLERICRPIEFSTFDGDISWMDRGERVTASFATKLPKRRGRQRLRAALSTEGAHPRSLLSEAHKKLLEIRAGSSRADLRAAGLVVAMDTDHANEIADELTAISGKRPVVVHNKIDDAQEAIDAFRASDDLWIVGVNMLSEGVDIPRLRVGVYASNIRAALYFHQFCGRLSRVIDKNGGEWAHVFMPEDSELVAIAKEIVKTRAHALGEEGDGRVNRIGNGGTRRRGLNVLGSEGELSSIVANGQMFPAEFIAQHRARAGAFRLMDASRVAMTDCEVIKIMIDLDVIEPPTAQEA